MAQMRDRSSLAARASRPGRRRRALAVAMEGLEPRLVMTQVAYGLFDTGVDAAGVALANGFSDPHYTVRATDQAGAVAVAAVPAASKPAVWVADTATTRWVGPTANQASTPSPAGTYRYETTFTLASVGGGTGTLAGSLTADDQVADILVNGISTGYTQPEDLGTPTAFSVPATFRLGTNTVEFVVINTGTVASPTGLYARDLALDFAPTVAVARGSVAVGSGGTVTNTGTFADLDPGDTVTLTSSRGTVTPAAGATNSGTFTFSESNVTVSGPVTITATDNRGNAQTTTFDITATPPALAGGGNTVAARSGGSAVTVNPTLVLNDAGGGNLTTASVSIGANFTPAEDRLLFADQNGITGSYDQARGILTLTGSATPAQYQAALRSVQYQDVNADPVTANRAPRAISFSIAPGTFNPDNGHFYQFVRSTNITWTDARAAADASTLYGIRGYLASLTSAAENTFAYSKTLTTGWIGGSDAANPGTWRWVDGPDAGLEFWNGVVGGSPVNGQFSQWAPGQPDNSGGNQRYLRFLSSASGVWDDLENDAPTVEGYLIEFGGSAGDPTLQLTAATTVDVTSVTDAPTVATPAAPRLTNQPTATVAGTADAGSTVRVYLDANNNGVVDAGEAVVGTQQLAVGATAYSIAATLAPNVANHLIVTATYGTAAESSATAVPTITSDTIPPAVPVLDAPAAGASPTRATSTDVAGTAEAGSLVRVYLDSNGNGVVDAGDAEVGSRQLAAGATRFDFPGLGLTADATTRFLVTATDAAGNTSGPAGRNIVQDSTAPAPPTVTDPAAAKVINAATYTITGTAEAGSRVVIYADPGRTGSVAGRTVVGTQLLAAGQTTYAITVPLTANAANDFLATATDEVGNESAPAVVPTITADSAAPAAPVLTPPTVTLTAPAPSTVAIAGTAEAGSLVTVFADANNNGTLDAGEAVVGTVQLAAGQSAFRFDAPLGGDSSRSFLVTATDAAGNRSAPATFQAIVQANQEPGFSYTTVRGRVYREIDANNQLTPDETLLGGRVVYLDLNNSGARDAGEPTFTTSSDGTFAFTGLSLASIPVVREDGSQDAAYRYFLNQTREEGGLDGVVTATIGVIPYSPILPVALDNSSGLLTGNVVAIDGSANGFYVRSLYQTILGRAAGDAEVAAWTAAIAGGATDNEVAARIINSPEHRTAQVTSFYQSYLHRAPDPGMQHWVDAFLAGASDEEVSAGILNSAEYQSAHADPSLLIRDLYLDVLGRVGGDSEVAAYLAAGTSPTGLVDQFLNSPEANDQIVDSLYTIALRRRREPGSSVWTDLLAAKTSAGAVAAGVLSSPEFRLRAAQAAAVSNTPPTTPPIFPTA